MGSHHKRNEGMKPVRRMASKPKPEKRTKSQTKDARTLALLEMQQVFLNHLARHFDHLLAWPEFEDKLQVIKGHFFHREYVKVFNDAELCRVYSVRYLPSRALAYAELFAQPPVLDLLYPPPPPRRPSEPRRIIPATEKKRKVVAVGAGVGSELSALHLMNHIQQSQLDEDDEDLRDAFSQTLEIDIIDLADYREFLSALNKHLLQEYGRTLAEQELDLFKFKYHQQDILSWSDSAEFSSLLAETTLLTFMFVFNELFAVSKRLTMQLIAAIAKHLPHGSHVLLIESAGDLSKVSLGTDQKVTDHDAEEEARKGLMVYKFWDHLPGFEKIMSEDRKWYRVDTALQYPLDLENVGYFVRLYRKIV